MPRNAVSESKILLYCIGTDAGGFYAETYNFMDSGCCSTFSFLSGSTAAENVAKEQGIEVESIYAEYCECLQSILGHGSDHIECSNSL